MESTCSPAIHVLFLCLIRLFATICHRQLPGEKAYQGSSAKEPSFVHQGGRKMNNARNKRIVEMFERRGEDFHALVCRTPQNVVMLTGYQPILGNSFCVVTVNKAREVEI